VFVALISNKKGLTKKVVCNLLHARRIPKRIEKMKLYDRLLSSKPFFLISGPCVIEDESLVMRTAETLKKLCEKYRITYIFKSSYLKANRTCEESYTGPGLDRGLKVLERIKREFSLPILTDVHETNEIESVVEVADILQIPAFLCRQTPLIKAVARTGKIVNIKKGQFMAAEDIKSSAEKVTSENNYEILLTERGSCFGYHDLVVDFRSFPIMKDIGYPVIYDVTHSLQRPSLGRVSGGNPEYASIMAKAALATGMVDGLYIEAHPNPVEALSDGMSMVELDKMDKLLHDLITTVNI